MFKGVIRCLFWLAIFCLVNACSTKQSPQYMAEGSLEARLQKQGLQQGDHLFIRIFKEEKQLEVWMQKDKRRYIHFGNYPICAFSGRLGPKRTEGDLQSPEGFYRVSHASLNPNSRFHKSFNLNYPNAFDRYHGRTGSHLMVHGDCKSTGCYAMTDRQIEEIYYLLAQAFYNGQDYVSVHIFPFKMTNKRLKREKNSENYPFWQQQKPIYRSFERSQIVPVVDIQDGKYVTP